MIGFDQPTYVVVEDEHYVNITVVLTGRTSREVLIALNTRDGSALCEYYIYNAQSHSHSYLLCRMEMII